MKLNLRFGLIFWAVQCAWILGEFALGWHTTDVDVTRGATVGLVVGVLSIPFHWAYTSFLNPDYVANMVQSMADTGTATLEEATAQFAMPGYAMGLLIFPVVAGIMTNAVLALFLKTSWR